MYINFNRIFARNFHSVGVFFSYIFLMLLAADAACVVSSSFNEKRRKLFISSFAI